MEMESNLKIAFASVISVFIFGCASTGDNLQRETARSIGGNTSV